LANDELSVQFNFRLYMQDVAGGKINIQESDNILGTNVFCEHLFYFERFPKLNMQ